MAVFNVPASDSGFLQTKGPGPTSVTDYTQGTGLTNYARDVGITLNDDTRDYLIQAYLNDQASNKAWYRSVDAAQNQYQWLVKDLIKAGINPMQAFNGLNAANATSSASGVSGGLITSKENIRNTNRMDLIRTIITALGTIVGLALFKGSK